MSAINDVKQKFFAMPQRDQMALGLLVIAVVLFGFYQLAWAPLVDKEKSLTSANASLRTSVANVQQLATEYKKLKGSGSATASSASLPRLIDSTARANQLKLGRVQPNSTGDVQVRFDDAVFDQVLTWLNELESKHGVTIKELNINPGKDTGLVNANVRLGGAA